MTKNINSPEAKLKAYRDAIADPLSIIKTKDNPQVTLSSTKPLRSAAGIADFEDMILQSNENFQRRAAPNITTNLSKSPFFAMMGKEYENVNLSNLGADAVATIQNTSTIDVSIISHLTSFAQYCAVERPMPTENVTISWRNLVDAKTGDIIFKDNFGYYPLTAGGLFAKKVFALQPGVAGSNALSLGSAVSPLTVTFTVTDTATNEVVLLGSDANSKGAFLYSVNKIAGPGSVNINYDTGIVTVNGAFDTYTLRVDATSSLGDEDGANVKRLTTAVDSTSMKAEVVRLDYVDDALKQLIWNKNLSNSNINGDLIADTTHQLSLAFINDMNNRVMANLIEAATTNGLLYHTYNIADYNIGGSFADTKYDFIEQSIMDTASEFAFESDQAATSLFVTNTLGVLLNGIRTGSFVAANTIFSQNDGVIGTLNGMPVIRSRFLQRYEDMITAEAIAVVPVDPKSGKPYVKIPFILANKMIDGSVATLAVGEYLPIFSTSMINNYLNPTQFGSAFVAINAVAIISKKMARIGYIIVDRTKNA